VCVLTTMINIDFVASMATTITVRKDWQPLWFDIWHLHRPWSLFLGPPYILTIFGTAFHPSAGSSGV